VLNKYEAADSPRCPLEVTGHRIFPQRSTCEEGIDIITPEGNSVVRFRAAVSSRRVKRIGTGQRARQRKVESSGFEQSRKFLWGANGRSPSGDSS